VLDPFHTLVAARQAVRPDLPGHARRTGQAGTFLERRVSDSTGQTDAHYDKDMTLSATRRRHASVILGWRFKPWSVA
jgi:hypothetical protein